MLTRITSGIIIVLLLCLSSLRAGEGMWLPQLLKMLNEKEMKSMGMKITADDIYNINKGSLKDAIVHFGGFCTSEVISAEGLLLTNHHCGYEAIQSHTTLQNNLIKNGFWAKTKKDELPNAGLTATFIDRIDDVTSRVLAGLDGNMTPKDRQAKIDANIADVRKSFTLESYQDVIIRSFFDGNQYFAFVTTMYKDVRLVGAPSESIGKFGADTDNWVWPRHTGDFSLFRIYAGKDNKPADYSKDNVPYVPKHFLPISMDGVAEGDFTMVFGFPGRTQQYLPSYAVSQILESINPARIKIREEALSIMDKYMRANEAIKIKYASKYASIANYWKKWVGESQGLKQTNAVDKKKKYEKEFRSKLPKGSPYSNLLPELEKYYADINKLAIAREYFGELQRNVEIMGYISSVRRLMNTLDKNGKDAYREQLAPFKESTKEFYKDLETKIDREKLGVLMALYVKGVDKAYVPGFLERLAPGVSDEEYYQNYALIQYSNSVFNDEQRVNQLFSMDPEQVRETLKTDPMYEMVSNWTDFYNRVVAAPYNDIKREIDSRQELYTKAQLEAFKERRFYPDANSTMRVTYGKVEGYKPKDAVYYEPITYLDGILEKYIPGDYEFDLQPTMLDLYRKKDYGPYADNTGKLPVCFIGSNHTTGGNSGSPAIDANGNLIGLNFDRVWEGTMSDINYDVSICRNIMVDARYILWVIDKYAGAGHLVEEMKLVYPKTGKRK
jgi:hypothetical protein